MRTLFLSVVLLAAGAGQAVAQEEEGQPAYVAAAWRDRLVTLAPACGKRDATWGAKARQAIAIDIDISTPEVDVGLLGAKMPDPAVTAAAYGAMAQAEYLFSKERPTAQVCNSLVSEAALSNTDQLIEQYSGRKDDTVDASASPFTLADVMRLPATRITIVTAEVVCGRRSVDWGQKLITTLTGYGELVMIGGLRGKPTETSVDQARAAADGAAQESLYYSQRMLAALGRRAYCAPRHADDVAGLDAAIKAGAGAPANPDD